MKKLMTLMMLAGLMLMITATIVFALKEGSANVILEGVEASSPLNWNSEKLVWKTGKIDFIDSGGVVIGDIKYQWSKFGVRFRGIDGKILNAGSFNQGTKVTFVLDSGRKTIVTLIKGEVAEETKD